MSAKIADFMATLSSQEPPAGLLERILQKIQDLKALRRLKQRLFLFACGLACSFTLVILGMNILSAERGGTAFWHYFSLVFTDTDIVLAYWQDVLFNLLESIPVLNIMAALTVIFFCLGLVRLAVEYRSTTHHHLHLT